MKVKKIISLGLISIALAGCVSNTGLDNDKYLVIHSDFEEDASDSSKNGYDGVLKSGARISEDCMIGLSSVYLNGVSAYVEYPSGNVYFDGDYTISIWAKWEECHVWDRLFEFGQVMPLEGETVTLRIGTTPEGDESLWLDQCTTYEDVQVSSILDQKAPVATASLNYKVQPGEWHHYVVVYDASASNSLGKIQNLKGETVPFKGKAFLYVDGQKVSENEYCFRPLAVPTKSNWLGRSIYRSDPHFQGWLDDFRLYSRCLSEDEIAELYKMAEI